MSKIEFNEALHLYTVDGEPKDSVTQIISQEGMSSYGNVPKHYLEAAASFGTNVHLATELYDKGTLDMHKLDAKLAAYLRGWIKFKEAYKPEMLYIEEPFYSSSWDYCGTIDRVAKIGNDVTIIDIKTSASIVQSYELQMAGYKIGWMDSTKMTIHKLWIVQLKPETFKVYPYLHVTPETVWKSMMVVRRYKKARRIA